jgi:antitoxin HicB
VIAYPVMLTPDEDTWLVTSRDFPELTTFGTSKEAALFYAVGALREAIAARFAYREDIPLPSRPRKGERLVTLPAQAAIKLMLFRSMLEKGLRKSDLAARIGVHKQEMDRIFSPTHATNLAKIEKAFAALGKELDIAVIDAR